MKSFKQILNEAAVPRRIFTEPPSPHETPRYNQITTRGVPLEFEHVDDNSQIQKDYRSTRINSVHTSDGAWDATVVGSKNLKQTQTESAPYQKGVTFKKYFSVEDSHKPEVVKKFAAAIPDLHSRLHALADHFGTSFQFKVPKHAKSFGEHTDSLVVHHYDMPDTSLTRSIHATVHDWAQKNGLSLGDRQGLDDGADMDGKSFSEHLATGIGNQSSGRMSLSQVGKDILNRGIERVNQRKV